MKYFVLTLVVIACSLSGFSQQAPDTSIYNKEFKWSIVIPAGFSIMNVDSVNAMHERGAAIIKKSHDEKIEDNTTNIFMFKNNKANYFESCSQPFDTVTDGNFAESIQLIGDVLHQSFTSQIKNIAIDTSYGIEIISGLEFHKLNMKVLYPNGLVFHVNMYCRLFGKKELAINIYYLDEMKGFQMLNALRNSKFQY